MSIRAILLGSLACLCVNGAAQASSVTLEREVSSNPWGNEDWAESVTRSYNNQSSTLEAGMFRLQDANSMEKLFAFCIEPGVAIDLNSSFDTMVTASPWAARMTDIDKLFTSALSQVVNAPTAAAFQATLWEIVGETTTAYDLDSGNVSYSSMSLAAKTAAEGFITGLSTAGTGGYAYTTFVNNGQDLITAAPVPLPASALLLLGGMGGLTAMRRRKAK